MTENWVRHCWFYSKVNADQKSWVFLQGRTDSESIKTKLCGKRIRYILPITYSRLTDQTHPLFPLKKTKQNKTKHPTTAISKVTWRFTVTSPPPGQPLKDRSLVGSERTRFLPHWTWEWKLEDHGRDKAHTYYTLVLVSSETFSVHSHKIPVR